MAGKTSREAPTARRERLTKDRVIRTAVDLADRGGLDALTMRRLAEELGVVPMALYKHVANKEELLDGMVDVVFAEVTFSSGGGWKAAMRERAVSMRGALLRHPWAIGRMEAATPGPANLAHHNAVLGCLRGDAGFPFETAVHAYSVMDAYIYGFALQDETLPIGTPEEAAAEVERRAQETTRTVPAEAFAEAFPYLVEVVAALGAEGYDHAKEFAFGLDLILDGIERLRDEA